MLKLCLSISSTCKKWIPIFFFFFFSFNAIDLDEEERLKNVCRVGATSREEYKIFGDVVSFDTTYITNKYKCHLLHLLEWTNHLQSVLLGCALLGDETASTFTWLMETWVRAMGGKASTALLTDQDRAMKAAIGVVFPNTQSSLLFVACTSEDPRKAWSCNQEQWKIYGSI